MTSRPLPEAGIQPHVVTVILNWNDGSATLACLRALAATIYPRMTVIVVDNGSTDGSADSIAAAQGITIIRNKTNLGFTGGVNSGIRCAMDLGADYVWLLNSDAITSPDVLGRLVAVAEADSSVGLVSPVFHDPQAPERAEFCLGLFNSEARMADQTSDPRVAAHWQATHPERVLLLGTALLIRRRLIETIGIFDDRFFAYVEDVDYSLRSAAAGFRNVAVADAVVMHKFKEPVAHPDCVPPYLHYFMSRNYPLLWRKLPPPVFMRRSTVWFLRQRLLQILRMPDDKVAIDALLTGLWDGFRGRGGGFKPERRVPRLLRFLLLHSARTWLCLLERRLPRRSAGRSIAA